MSTIGKEVAFIKTSETNARNGEGAFIRLKDGRIMYAYTEYVGNDWSDDAVARISAVISSDEGESWKEKVVLFEPREGEQNVMSVSLINMENGDIGIFYLTKSTNKDEIYCTPTFRRSSDGLNWGEPIKCAEEDKYYVVNNDRVIRLKSGRLAAPVALHGVCKHGEKDHSFTIEPGKIQFVISDDDGYSWKMLPVSLKSPFNDERQLQEPGLYQHEDGTIWLYIRTNYGFQLEAFSNDNCESWSNLEANMFFSSPPSPMLIKKVKDYTLAIFNPIPRYTTRDDGIDNWGRSPFLCAVSKTDGKGKSQEAFDKVFFLEEDRKNGYCYPSVFEGDDYFLAAYYHSEGTNVCLKSTKIKKIMYSELESIK